MPSPNRLELYQRTQEAIEYLMELGGHSESTKSEFSYLLGVRHGKVWLRGDGTGNVRLLQEVAALTKDQDVDPYAKEICAGYVINYAPNFGGITLTDPDGEMTMEHSLHMLAGDLLRQQNAKTIMRRRVQVWNAAGHLALKTGETDIGRVTFQIEREIESSGFVSESLVVEFLRLIRKLGIEPS